MCGELELRSAVRASPRLALALQHNGSIKKRNEPINHWSRRDTYPFYSCAGTRGGKAACGEEWMRRVCVAHGSFPHKYTVIIKGMSVLRVAMKRAAAGLLRCCAVLFLVWVCFFFTGCFFDGLPYFSPPLFFFLNMHILLAFQLYFCFSRVLVYCA